MITLVVGNTKPDINLQVRRDGVPVDLTGCTVVFKLRKPSGAILTLAMSLTDPALGNCSGNFGSGDLDETGSMLAELVITYPDGTVQNVEEPFRVFVRGEFAEAPR